MDLVGNPQAQAALQEWFEQLLTRVQQLSVIAEHQQQEIAELKAQLGQQSSFAQSSFQSYSDDVSHPSPSPSVKPKKPETFLKKAPHHKDSSRGAGPHRSDLSLADPPGEASRGGQGRRNPHHVIGGTKGGVVP
uniref:Uncharacterized protein n=1 Tax=Chromera velia CCMP2878 TaxID=1169474 RepID=A0A0G4HYW2_9ALVE|eukprot:Cvel_9588.t1-p1 / transcript=Cvel_9588.t1 / gene=Cvel_9588 / organism=Chromera_velia_CCMP2878 / gene_product=hypothetical protein / transcript_product=hypothetical protein / location=Cvel_scaffold556:47203-47601(+) / protein_length=133 / sequence_SO=supercontig / SO=protein_coding / is_pseudo=false